MEQHDYHIRAYRRDVSNYESATECVGTIQKVVGQIDVLVNNADITRDVTFKKMDKPTGMR